MRFGHHRGEINRLKIREKESKEEVEKLIGFIIGAGHEAQIFKNLPQQDGGECLQVWENSFRGWGGVCFL